MSENEKIKRQNYKRQRKKWIVIQSVLLMLVLIATVFSLLTYRKLNQTYYIEYTEKGDVDYKVQYEPTESYDEWLGEGQSYISELVKDLELAFNYRMEMETDVSYSYSYRVDAILEIIDKNNSLPIYDPVTNIVPTTGGIHNSGEKLELGRTVTVDFESYNNTALALIRQYQLRDVKSMLSVIMYIDVTGSSDKFEESASNSYSIAVNVPLTETTFSINTQEGVSADKKVLAVKSDINEQMFLNAAIFLAVLFLILIVILIAFIYLTRNDDINYNIKVKRIVSAYESYIQKINNQFDFSGYQVLSVGSFGDMLGIRDTIQSPILMSENEDQTATKFLIPTSTNLLYVFEIRVDNYDELYGTKEEAAPTAEEAPKEDKIPVTEEAPTVEETPAIEEAPATEEAPAAEKPPQEPTVIVPDITPEILLSLENIGADDGIRLVNDQIVHIRYRTSFMSRLIQAGDELQGYYTVLKNTLLSYKGVKARTSWAFESFNKGRIQCAKLNIKGTALQVYLGLNPEEYSQEKYKYTYVGNKPKLDGVPIMLKVKSEKHLKTALELIRDVMAKNEIKEGAMPTEDYRMPYESTEDLVDRELVKVIMPEGIVIDENTIVRKLNVEEMLKPLRNMSPASIADKVELIIEKDVDIEALEEAISEPTAELESIDFVDEIDAEYNETPEHPGVEVVGVVWPERAHKNKIYRYDPNGEKLADGDIVLVPTRDAARDKEVIRKAAIAHGNHVIDPDTLSHPLKKIIGVVKRKLEKALSE